MDGGNHTGDGVGLAERGTHEVSQRAVGDAAQQAEECAVVEEERSRALGHGEDELPVRDGVEDLVLEPVGPEFEALGVATGAEITGLAAEGDQELGITGLADDASKAIVENAAIEELLDGTSGSAAPAAVL